MQSKISEILQHSISVKQQVLENTAILNCMEAVTKEIVACFKRDGKLLFCGNGGSAADAQHLAAEFSGRFYTDREPLDAEALHVNTSYLTAVANDYSYNEVYARIVKAKGRKGDILIGLSTSGNSANIIEAFKVAKERGLIIVGFTGETGGKMASYCDYLLNIPSTDTPRIQECHITVGHIICQLVEEAYFDLE
ncbi:MAG TPA: D-sedoheptulose 7-phosphate isomerase [Chitinophagales bacterium]|jgi:D-sedoheptulose 7-phosphate isomerase|nr:D-sedoheptulose 7-phosphate isomerase [Chitinophagales bacterium]MBP6154033.1 D-sedoheptulose 7-phosphate isomerase [Chitinophagales bacterium]HQV78331.1 D-sedoheptulose 7-phosphate isomerase [Chitinophagales bacterium]HQW79482.1 D-sedoheptulose 7-phosphate isomerase [Chitinophagales bacterium]HRB67250.1 D-sedoheptulose 7-phosphate isomerase [Chitinophagales bacterium]